MDILHILNGDATFHSFRETGLEGDTFIWREVFSQGPLEKDIASGSFWRARQDWIVNGFRETPEGYQEKVLDKLADLSKPYDEINLWFEFDLHCQANLIGVMTFLRQKADLSLPAVYLICPADFPGKANFMGMGELTPDELEYLYDNIRVQLSEIDFIVAGEAWDVYVTNDAKKLEDYLTETKFWGGLHLLKSALEAQLKRLQTNENGLNYIEQKLFDIYNGGLKTKPEVYRQFWATEKIFGMGDAEIDIYLGRLQDKELISW